MQKLLLFISAALLALGTVSCSKTSSGQDGKYSSLKKITFEEALEEEIANPERGFLTHLEVHSGTPRPMPASTFEGPKLLKQSIVYTIYYLTDFIDCSISEEYLDVLKANLQTLREVGFKCVLRFAYKNVYTESDHPWDASPDVVNGHIDQLAPILKTYSDVILCLEAGFVGTWGEWYYTDNYVFQPKTSADYELRRQLLKKLLAALPSTRQVLVRYPLAKTMIFNISLADSLTVSTAHDGSEISRVGHHNDCFVSSHNDVGTYNSKEERNYVYNESRYTIWGGETCALTAYCNCEYAVTKFALHHATYMNQSYHPSVISRWREQKCFDEIKLRLGYRLSLTRAFLTPNPVAGEKMRVVLDIKNTGFAPPINPRAVELVLCDRDGEETVYKLKDIDPRYWFAGETSTVDTEIQLPADFGEGWSLYLNLPDPETTLHDNPAFSIHLSNKDMWDADRGYNLICKF